MAIHQTEFVYEPFADTEEYRDVNTDIVRGWIDSMVEKGNKEIDRLLDIATGIGTMVHIFVEKPTQALAHSHRRLPGPERGRFGAGKAEPGIESSVGWSSSTARQKRWHCPMRAWTWLYGATAFIIWRPKARKGCLPL